MPGLSGLDLQEALAKEGHRLPVTFHDLGIHERTVKLHRAAIMTKLGVYSAAHLQPITYLSAEAFLADTERPKFDCLVLDIQLKGMSGLDLRQRLFGVMDATPVIFITAHDDPEVRAQAEASGCAGYFRKMDSGADVLAAIRRTISTEDFESRKEIRS